jgi:outer membrane protein TolC
MKLLPYFSALILLLMPAILPAQSAAPPVGTNPDAVPITAALLHQLAAEALTNHPGLHAASARVDAATFNVAAVRIWEDPMFKFGGSSSSPRGFRESEEGNLIYGIEQKLPLFGKPDLTRRAAIAGTLTQQAEFELRFETLRRDLAKGLIRIALADRVVELGSRDLDWLNSMISLMEEKYRAGMATQVELVLMQNEKSRRADQLLTDQNKLDHERLGVNRLLNRDFHSPWPRLALPAIAVSIPYHSRFLDLATRAEPRIKVLQREMGQAQANVAVTRQTRLPDFRVGVEGRQYSDDGGMREGTFTLSFNLPWGNREKYRNDLRRDEATVKAVEADLTDYTFTVREEMHHLTVDLDAARREALLYRDEIVPRTEQAMASAHSAFESGRGLARDILDARRMLVEGQLMSSRAIAEQYQMLADLMFLCGLEDFDAVISLANTKP